MAFYGRVDVSKLQDRKIYTVRYATKSGMLIPTALWQYNGEWVYGNGRHVHDAVHLDTRDKRLLPSIKPSKRNMNTRAPISTKKGRVVVLRPKPKIMSTIAALFAAFYSSVASYLAFFGKNRDEPEPEPREDPLVKVIRADAGEGAYESSEM